MKLAVLDHETYYSKEYSLSKMSTEDYVNDDRFQSILVSLKIGKEPVKWFSGSTAEMTGWLYDHHVDECAVVCHNHMFDGLINAVRHGFVPRKLICTRFMAKPIIQPFTRSVSLASCLKYIGAETQKGSYVQNMLGRRRESLTGSELRDYAKYCCDDTEGTYELFRWLLERLPHDELDIIDMTLRMYIEPQLLADSITFSNIVYKERQRKEALLAALPPDVDRPDLMSNPKFAQVLRSNGVEPPTKISPTTGKATWAFAKNDPQWKDMLEEYEDDPIIGPILLARQGVKSTIAETRAERLRDIGTNYRVFRVPLVYYQAHTGRYGGTEKINAQNFNRINPKDKSRDQLRYGIQAPKGFVVMAPDLSQIEARLNAWFSNCRPLVDLFRDGKDVYSAFASRLFAMPVTKANWKERFIGKTCILGLGYGMGAPKLQATLRKDIKVSAAEAQEYVDTYRTEYPEIPAMWRRCDNAIETLVHGGKQRIGPVLFVKGAIELPNGLRINYPNLKWVETDKYTGWAYQYAGIMRTLWGGKVVENIIQTLAQIKIKEAMIGIRGNTGYRPAMQAHDELVYVVREDLAEDLLDEFISWMVAPSKWAPNLPLAAEGAYGPTYGDCK